MSKNNLLFFLIIILSVFLRFFYLGKIPPGFYSDEAAYGYNAYSILLTDKDEYGNFLPLAFKSFGDYKAPLYIYFLTPFVKIFGLTEASIRLSSAILGLVLVVIVYLLTREIFSKRSVSLLSAFLTAIMPLGLQFNRMAHENNLSIVLVTLGILFFLKSLKSSFFIIFSLISFAVSLYAYHDARVITPLIIAAIFIIYRNYLWKIKRKVLAGMIIFFLTVMPFVNLFSDSNSWARPKYTVFSSDKGITLETNQARGEDEVGHFFAPFFFHNKVISYPFNFLENYFKHFDFDFLFFTGDYVKIYQTLGNGLMYFFLLPFFLAGIYFLIRRPINYKEILLIWLISSPIPPALTRFVPSASRFLVGLPILSIIVAVGLIITLEYIKSPILKRVYLVFISFILSLNIAYYLHYYYFNTPIRYAQEWHYGMRAVMDKVKEIQENYSSIWFSKEAWGYIYPLFYLPFPPEKYQPQAKLGSLNEFGFGWVRSFDKYIFDDFPLDLLEREDTLFIGAPVNFYKLKKPLSTVYYPDGNVAFYLADHSSF